MRKRILSMALCLCLIAGAAAGCGRPDGIPVVNEGPNVTYMEMEDIKISTPEPTEEPEPELYRVTSEDMAINLERLAWLIIQNNDKMYTDYKRCAFEILEEVSAETVSSTFGLGATNSAIHVSEDLDVDSWGMNRFIDACRDAASLTRWKNTGAVARIEFKVIDSNIWSPFVYYADTNAVVTVVYEMKFVFREGYEQSDHKIKVSFVVNGDDPTDWLIYDIDSSDKYNSGEFPIIKERLKNDDGSVSHLAQTGTLIDGGEFHGLKWVYTDANELIITGNLEKGDPEGQFTDWLDIDPNLHLNLNRIPWLKYAEEVKTAILSFSGAEDLKYFFKSPWEYNGTEYIRRRWQELREVDMSGLDTSNVTTMASMFSGCKNLIYVEMSGLDTSNVTTISGMFTDCKSLPSVDMSGLDLSNVTGMASMFNGCESLTNMDMSGWNLSPERNMSQIFARCSSLESVNMSGQDCYTGSAGMFIQCPNLTSIDLSGWNEDTIMKIKEDIKKFCETANIKY